MKGEFTRVYRARDPFAHYRADDSPGYILCLRRAGALGGTYDPAKWKGTGSQEEYDKAAGMSLCMHCRDIAATSQGVRRGRR